MYDDMRLNVKEITNIITWNIKIRMVSGEDRFKQGTAIGHVLVAYQDDRLAHQSKENLIL